MLPRAKPSIRPANPNFSSGPCTKHPGWSPAVLSGALTGRSHRSSEGRARLAAVIADTRALLGLPPDYRLAIMPGSDTGAFEMALWSLLGARPVDVLAWEAFGKLWLNDIVTELKLGGVRTLEAGYGELPDLNAIDPGHDVVFTANGTTSGVRVPDYSWISPSRRGLTICDATSAVFAQEIDWQKIDCLTFSWQKALGGEAGHGMMVLSPRAVERLESTTPPWPRPKLFRMTKGGRLDDALFEGQTINTPSMLCVEDWASALRWAQSVGGAPALRARADANAKVVYDWMAGSSWAAPLARVPATRSNTSVCLRLSDANEAAIAAQERAGLFSRMAARLEREGVAYDIRSYRDAPPGLRIWAGPTVEAADLAALLPWLDWAFFEAGKDS